VNLDSRSWPDSRNKLQQVVPPQRDAACGRPKRIARDVNENRAAKAGDARAGIVVDLDNEIVEVVLAAEPVAWFIGRALKGVVIAAIGRVLAPGVVRRDPAGRKAGLRAFQAIGAPPQADGMESSNWRTVVAFALRGPDSAASEGDLQRFAARNEPALRPQTRPGSNANRAERRSAHPVPAPIPNRRLLLYRAMFYFAPHWAAKPARLVAGDIMPNTRTILIVDDDTELREALTEQLSLHEEFEAVAVENGSKGVQTAKTGQIDLVIMDVGLPDIDGREAVRILRKNGFKAPIIMLTGHDTDSDTILGLESGANDYVTKPFRFAVLLARIRAQLRQHEASEDAVFTIGPYTFRPSSKLLLNPKGSKVRLTEKETSILRYLYRAGQKPVSRETLLQEVWGYNSGVTTHTLETHIYRLRQKIEKDAAAPAILVTEAGGYKLVP
jgi:DNA-binding response OmpR family regulator